MFFASDLPHVTIRDLSRNWRGVMDRVLRGERLIVSRHGHPIATLQPLNGCVTQPFEGRQYDVKGSPLQTIDHEIAKLRPDEKKLLMDAVKGDRIWGASGAIPNLSKVMSDWEVRGLVRKTRRGRVLTGRAMVLREALLERAGLRERLYE